ncbi:hypothetical protein MCERE155_01033 [Candidatus Nanopelagicaceae bacterium]
MNKLPNPVSAKVILGAALICVSIVGPRSWAEDLLSPLMDTVEVSTEPSAESPSPSDSAVPSDSPTATLSSQSGTEEAPQDINSSSEMALTLEPSDSATASVSPIPVPPHAIANQQMQIAVPSTISIDPRAHSTLLPRLHVNGVETLLVCGYSNSAGVHINGSIPGVESTGSGSPNFRISGPEQLVMATINGTMGARIFANSQGLQATAITFYFVAVSKSSIDQALCGEGSPSNIRRISFRALNMEVNMAKGAVGFK